MKVISKKQWKECPTSYKKKKKDGTRYMLYNDKGETVWGIVIVK